MCRLLGVASATPVTVVDAVGEAVLKDFVALAKVHGDGWGLAHVDDPDGTPEVRVSATNALDDPHFAAATSHIAGSGGITHLRWATEGLAVIPENCHPFLTDGIAMAHNGSIKPLEPLDELLTPEARAGLRGTTDSERYFALIRQHRARTPTLAEAVRRAVSQLRGIYPRASLNALVLGEGHLIAVHAHAQSRLPVDDIETLSALDLPAEHVEDYFALRIARPDSDTVVIGSTGFGDLDWQALAPETVTAVALDDLTVTSAALGSG
ncbi:class II glutamine amidotransferase [Mycobacterium sp. CVI_P3]|uniref:Class II glutamine amidotransferase n=1 Tax=Mycobacterium pinniadriaticum TaxID=2994102 RepID=A0ABT3SCJ1_9MYCO|nr:class II glutamine amidotransferase [Mycobacterium pinniadriaticum]MCX2930316.1 class II glutamine amidotransferase [Mycobacterium pinniadriaticum]MCX2936622.1 class II glutamine amidotransferase [Mycobacterium pinniadriaticum]